jgi:hypothetical protein
MSNSWFFRIFGGALIALGFWLMIGGEIVMPTRSALQAFHFADLSLWLLAAAPALIGVAFWRMGDNPERRNNPIFRLMIGVGMALLGLSFVLAKTY